MDIIPFSTRMLKIKHKKEAERKKGVWKRSLKST